MGKVIQPSGSNRLRKNAVETAVGRGTTSSRAGKSLVFHFGLTPILSPPVEAGLGVGTDVRPGLYHRAILNHAAKSAALLLDGNTDLDKSAACCVSAMHSGTLMLSEMSQIRERQTALNPKD